MIVVAIVSSVILLQFHWFGDAASTQRGPIDTLFDVMIVLSCVVFSIVIVMFVYAIWKFRVKPGDEGDGKPIHGNTKLEIAWTVIPTVIVLFGAGYSWVVLDDIESKAADSMRLDVTAQQFEWSFGYPEKMIGTGASATEVTTHELHVPVDRQLNVHLHLLRGRRRLLDVVEDDPAVDRAEEDDDRRDHRPGDLELGVAVDRLAIGLVAGLRAVLPDAVAEHDEDDREDERREDDHHVEQGVDLRRRGRSLLAVPANRDHHSGDRDRERDRRGKHFRYRQAPHLAAAFYGLAERRFGPRR